MKSWLIWNSPYAGKDWGQEEKETTEDEMVRWHHQLNEHEFGWTPGVGDGQGGLMCCGSWGPKESDTTEQLNWTELYLYSLMDLIVFSSPYLIFKYASAGWTHTISEKTGQVLGIVLSTAHLHQITKGFQGILTGTERNDLSECFQGKIVKCCIDLSL